MMKIGLVYGPIYLEHDTSGKDVETDKRLIETMSILRRDHLIDKLYIIAPRSASKEELMTVHTIEHVEQIENLCRTGGGWIDEVTIVSSASYKVAQYAVGGVIEGLEALMGGQIDKVFALIRPPGHHATTNTPMGFCLFNNIAIAAKRALTRDGLDRVMIVDYDVHHGNGTQEIFYDSDNVLYFSVHQSPPFYPSSGFIEEIGTGAGIGTTVNVPLAPESGDSEYMRVFNEILIPLARRFRPQLILVSAGYDPHWTHKTSQIRVSVDGFSWMVNVLDKLADELCNGRILFALEGGYNITALAYSVKATIERLLGYTETIDPLGYAPKNKKPDIDDILEAVKKIHKIS